MGILPSGNPATWNLAHVNMLIANVINLAMLIAGGVAAIYIVIGAFSYFTAFGNDEKAGQAKKTITWAIVGVVVIVLSKVIISWVWNFVAPAGNNPSFPV